MDPELKALETEMNRGFIQVLLLAALEQRMYGYGLSRHLAGLGYAVEENTLYPLLRRLEKNGCIRSTWEVGEGRPRRFYVITDRGREVRRQALEVWSGQARVLEKVMEANRDV
jgi:PadR family transcriptional regulator PadR